jgi:hypothetical protein
MPTLNSTNGTIKLVTKKEDHVANVDKVNYTTIKGKGDAFPKAATVILYGVSIIEGEILPKTFDVVADEDNGVVQKRTRILNCEVQGEIGDNKTIAVSTANDVSMESPLERMTKLGKKLLKDVKDAGAKVTINNH